MEPCPWGSWGLVLLDTGMTPMVWWSVIISQAGLHRCTGGVAPCKVLNCKKLQLFPFWKQLKSIVLCWFCSNLVKTSKKGGRPQEHVCFITRHGQAGTCSNLSKLRGTLCTSASSPVMVLVGTLFLPIWQAGMLKICVSALKSACWNFLKFQKVQRTPPWVHSVTQAVVHRMTATANPNQMGVGKGMDIIIKAGLHLRSGCLIPQGGWLEEVELVRNPYMFHGGRCVSILETVCDSAFQGLSSNLSERLQGCWRCA